MNKLLKHFRKMQDMARGYVEPTPAYVDREGGASNAAGSGLEGSQRNWLFAKDMLYMLDGPEQRDALTEAQFDFVAEAKQTLSPAWHGDMVAKHELVGALNNAIDALNKLDKVKKTLFYGRDNNIDPRPGQANVVNLPLLIQDTQKQVHGIEMTLDAVYNVVHGAIGYATEAGEMLEMLKHVINGGKLDTVNMLEEVGDGKWYMAILLDTIGYEWGEDERRVIAKLRARFPDKFKEYDANNRDLAAERAILEGDAADQLPLDIGAEEVRRNRYEAGGGYLPVESQHVDHTKRHFNPK